PSSATRSSRLCQGPAHPPGIRRHDDHYFHRSVTYLRDIHSSLFLFPAWAGALGLVVVALPAARHAACGARHDADDRAGLTVITGITSGERSHCHAALRKVI